MSLRSSHVFFTDSGIQALTAADFDEQLARYTERLVGVFFWGHDCPNCEVAKNTLLPALVEFRALGFKWFDVNVYENFDLGTRFGLHGVPAFLFFYRGKKLGRISPFPGREPFFTALEKLKRETPQP